jgi:hypothetical protein
MMKTKLKASLLGIMVVAALLQTVQPDRSNPEVTAPLEAPPEVMAVLKRACYDCHSNETRWPWYSYLSPVSILVANHVHEGREHLNFSDWTTMDAAKQMHTSSEILEVLDKGEMPLTSYLLLHGDAELSSSDKALLRSWAAQGE